MIWYHVNSCDVKARVFYFVLKKHVFRYKQQIVTHIEQSLHNLNYPFNEPVKMTIEKFPIYYSHPEKKIKAAVNILYLSIQIARNANI